MLAAWTRQQTILHLTRPSQLGNLQAYCKPPSWSLAMQVDCEAPRQRRHLRKNLESGTKRHLKNFVYKRRNGEAKDQPKALPPSVHPLSNDFQNLPPETAPIIQSSKVQDQPYDEGKTATKPQAPAAQLSSTKDHASKTDAALKTTGLPAFGAQRFFHMSRASMQAPSSRSRGSGITKESQVSIRHRSQQHGAPEAHTETTMERKIKKPSARRLNRPAPSPADTTPNSTTPTPDAAAKGPGPEPDHKPLPPVNRTDETDKIAADMDQWVLHEIGLNLAEIKKKTPASPSRFKPKAPAKRFAERHPELARELDARDAPEAQDVDMSDDDYEIVVYELAPDTHKTATPLLALGQIPPEQIGVLKFDTEEDMELFYGFDESDSDELPDDEEDENAENHYTADYPEDEVDSDDEALTKAVKRRKRHLTPGPNGHTCL
ncbi:uncharacterized protein VDAG_06508 [Verticillium dahliae VdLs.17]|uniref:Transcription factor Iwr1 domain-containing protein n=1 Tax=Verticillium dahliae (strain VdLs.17 / ATCC MYA-4575 / FGSC 10137) TaxID=498257 RepID=G2X7Q0_VERDV|nr:uncharacterized protein VDAG_06508 [Verticillium dahliae VdLs.17]EGY15018.1 hypothetical protein VDAG_06508 [Verticillium dahliae VdLs.17]